MYLALAGDGEAVAAGDLLQYLVAGRPETDGWVATGKVAAGRVAAGCSIWPAERGG